MLPPRPQRHLQDYLAAIAYTYCPSECGVGVEHWDALMTFNAHTTTTPAYPSLPTIYKARMVSHHPMHLIQSSNRLLIRRIHFTLTFTQYTYSPTHLGFLLHSTIRPVLSFQCNIPSFSNNAKQFTMHSLPFLCRHLCRALQCQYLGT